MRLNRSISPLGKYMTGAGGLVLIIAFLLLPTRLQGQTKPGPGLVEVVSISGDVELQPAGAADWRLLKVRAGETLHVGIELKAGDRFRTLARSQAVVRLGDGTTVTLNARSYLRVNEPSGPQSRLFLFRGLYYFFHRDKPGNLEIETQTVAAGVEGTEFHVAVEEDGATRLDLIDGRVQMRQLQMTDSRLNLGAHEAAWARPGQPLQKTAVLETVQLIQWCLYYPAVLDLNELALSENSAQALASSLAAYRRGNLLRALREYPLERVPSSPAEQVYLAALWLAVGQVDNTQNELRQARASATNDPRLPSLIRALDRLIAAVQLKSPQDLPTPTTSAAAHQSPPVDPPPASASEWLAASYQQQSAGNLHQALLSAREAAKQSPQFGFAWARVAELEFCFGRLGRTGAALERCLALSPENAQAIALQGFVASAGNRVARALDFFNAALHLDPALGNAWLGRGLCRIRRGEVTAGLQDLQMAAAREPQRALLRSYLAKGFDAAGEQKLARHELELAIGLDGRDPTAWLYQALMKYQGGQVNEAIQDLQASRDLAGNRGLYRSQLLLDQDRAVRQANLAVIYGDAGLRDYSVQEAARAVNSDYASAAAHLFLANSYNALRDPRQINLRYETPWLSEQLLANLMAPVGASPLAQTVSQQEYSKLLERDGVHIANETAWTSHGDWQESGAVFGQWRNFGYAVEGLYRSERGQRPNADVEQMTLSARFKQQITPQDTLYFQAMKYDYESGDVANYYDPKEANPRVRVEEHHEPIAMIGWHHEWQPGSHSLFLVAPWSSSLSLRDPENSEFLFYKTRAGKVFGTSVLTVPTRFDTEYQGVSAELQHIWKNGPNTLLAGLRHQSAEFDSESTLDNRDLLAASSKLRMNLRQAQVSTVERSDVYVYDHLEPVSWLLISAGLAYERLNYPVNFREAPVSTRDETIDQVSPKAGVTLKPWKGAAFRAAYARALSGVSFEQSFRLEPAQVAGFNQAYRGLMPESVGFVGSIPGQQMEILGVAYDQELPTHTYLTFSAEHLESAADRQLGAFVSQVGVAGLSTEQLSQDLDYEEDNLTVSLNQLLGKYLAVGANYRASAATLKWRVKDYADLGRDEESILHQVALNARFNHPSGFFAAWESVWTRQSNQADVATKAGDNYWQHNFWLGWRFWRRQAEIAAGVLNLADQDYRLYPLNYHLETYRDRTLVIRGRFNF